QYFRLTVNHHVPHPRYRLRHSILDPLLRLASASVSSSSAGNPYGSVPPGWSRDWHIGTYNLELLQGRGPQQAMWFEADDTIKGIRKCMPHVGYLQPKFELYRPTVPVKPKLRRPVIQGEIL
ncbi:MAG: hypothetical protein Q9214_005002, partial [Letrouitia sp. 1 TL-2023]